MCGYERRKIEAGTSIYGLRFYDFIVLILSSTLTRRRAQIAVSVIFAIFRHVSERVIVQRHIARSFRARVTIFSA